MKRLFTYFLTLALLLTVLPVVSAEQIVATADDVILLAGSDFQVSGYNTGRIENILNVLSIHGLTRADGAFFVGDYTLSKRETNTSSEGIVALKNLFQPLVGDNMIFTQGNHDHVDTVGLAKDGNNDPASGKYGVFVINENQRMEFNDDSSYDDTLEAANALKTYLDAKAKSGWTKPIFVLNHIPLHWSNRTIKDGSGIHANLLVDVLNEGGSKGLNIIYLYGHNHSGGNDDAMGGGAVYFKKGDEIVVGKGSKKKAETKTYTLNFTYMNAGFIGYYATTEPTADATVTMSVFLVRGDEVIITRYDEEINLLKNKVGIHNLKSAGVWHPDYSKPDYHVTPYTQVYKSSRKVTATADVEVESPNYAIPEPEETTTKTTAKVTTAKTTKKTTASTAKPHSPTKTTTVPTTENTAKTSVTATGKPTATDKTTKPSAATEAPVGSVIPTVGSDPSAVTTVPAVTDVPTETVNDSEPTESLPTSAEGSAESSHSVTVPSNPAGDASDVPTDGEQASPDLWWLWVLIGVVLCGGVGVFLWFGRKKS